MFFFKNQFSPKSLKLQSPNASVVPECQLSWRVSTRTKQLLQRQLEHTANRQFLGGKPGVLFWNQFSQNLWNCKAQMQVLFMNVSCHEEFQQEQNSLCRDSLNTQQTQKFRRSKIWIIVLESLFPKILKLQLKSCSWMSTVVEGFAQRLHNKSKIKNSWCRDSLSGHTKKRQIS